MDTRMLDVAIGLALVFALLSLLVTAVQEAHAAMRNTRGKNLARLVCSFVGDNKQLSQKILAQPFLVTMAMEQKSGQQRTPSYLSSDVFITGLLGYLTSNYTNGVRPTTPQQLIIQLKQSMPEHERTLLDSMATLLGGSDLDWPSFETRLCAWFDAVGERSSGWYKRENQVNLFVIGLVFSIMLNINPIIISQALWHDAALRKNTVAQAELALRAYESQTLQSSTSLAAGSPPPAKPPAFVSYDLDKNIISIRVLINSLAPPEREEFQSKDPAAFVRDSKGVEKLSSLLAQERNANGTDAKQREIRDTAAANFDLQLAAIHRAARLDLASQQECRNNKMVLDSVCEVFAPLKEAVEGAQAEIEKERKLRRAQQGDSAAKLLLERQCEKIENENDKALCAQFRSLGILEDAGRPIGWSAKTWPDFFPSCEERKCDPEHAGLLGLVFGAGNISIALAGWVITAIAATLGAPFWFDLLGRLVKLRSSGAKPEAENSAASSTAPGNTLAAAAKTDTLTATTMAASLDAVNEAERGLSTDEIVRIQRTLRMAPDKQDGRISRTMRDAISGWQKTVGATPNGELTAQQIYLLLNNIDAQKDDGYVG